MLYSSCQSTYFAHWLSQRGNYQDVLTQTITSTKIELNPHQIQTAWFVLRSPMSKGDKKRPGKPKLI